MASDKEKTNELKYMEFKVRRQHRLKMIYGYIKTAERDKDKQEYLKLLREEDKFYQDLMVDYGIVTPKFGRHRVDAPAPSVNLYQKFEGVQTSDEIEKKIIASKSKFLKGSAIHGDDDIIDGEVVDDEPEAMPDKVGEADLMDDENEVTDTSVDADIDIEDDIDKN